MFNSINELMKAYPMISLPIIGLAGPILCYLVVYGTASFISQVRIFIKYKRFKKRMSAVADRMEKENNMPDIESGEMEQEDENQNITELR